MNSLDRLSRIHLSLYFKNERDGLKGVKFTNLFGDIEYYEPDTPGTSGTISIYFNRFLIPRTGEYIWHPAKLCQALKLETSLLIFWGIACNIRGWKGTTRDLYKLVNRIDEEGDSLNIRVWKSRRLKPALKELAKNGFKITIGKNAYDEEEISIYWPSAKKALSIGRKEAIAIEAKTVSE